MLCFSKSTFQTLFFLVALTFEISNWIKQFTRSCYANKHTGPFKFIHIRLKTKSCRISELFNFQTLGKIFGQLFTLLNVYSLDKKTFYSGLSKNVDTISWYFVCTFFSNLQNGGPKSSLSTYNAFFTTTEMRLKSAIKCLLCTERMLSFNRHVPKDGLNISDREFYRFKIRHAPAGQPRLIWIKLRC